VDATNPFAAATAVRPLDGARFATTVADGWDIAGNANGGYLIALALRAVLAATGRPDVVTATAHYLAPGKPGPAEVAVDVLRTGRRFATASARLESGGRPVLALLATVGEVPAPQAAEPPLLLSGGPPDLPSPERCIARSRGFVEGGFADQVEIRLHPDDAGFVEGKPSRRAEMRGWFRLREDEPMDTVALALACDSLPPAVFGAELPVGWVPTVELTCHVRAQPAPGWLACRFATRFATGGTLEEDGEIWDSTGRLVAQSRQLALAPRG
jgi:acyl-CoA thioesterase